VDFFALHLALPRARILGGVRCNCQGLFLLTHGRCRKSQSRMRKRSARYCAAEIQWIPFTTKKKQ